MPTLKEIQDAFNGLGVKYAGNEDFGVFFVPGNDEPVSIYSFGKLTDGDDTDHDHIRIAVLEEISESEFFRATDESPTGIALDGRRFVFWLAGDGAQMSRRAKLSMIFSVELSPDLYHPRQLDWLAELPNVEQLQLAGTDVTDRDLAKLNRLPRLTAIGLENTGISDNGIRQLQESSNLERILFQDTKISSEAVQQLLNSAKARRLERRKAESNQALVHYKLV